MAIELTINGGSDITHGYPTTLPHRPQIQFLPLFRIAHLDENKKNRVIDLQQCLQNYERIDTKPNFHLCILASLTKIDTINLEEKRSFGLLEYV